MSQPFDFDAFLSRVAELDYATIVEESDREAGRAEDLSYRVVGRVANRMAGSVEYSRKLRSFLNFLKVRDVPGSAVDAKDWYGGYRDVAINLVRRGTWSPDVLKLFSPSRGKVD